MAESDGQDYDFIGKDVSRLDRHPLGKYLYLIRIVLRKYFARTRHALDLVGAGYLGLVRAQERFVPEGGYTFEKVALYHIRMAMLDEYRVLTGRNHKPVRRLDFTFESFQENQHAPHHGGHAEQIDARLTLKKLFTRAKVSPREQVALVCIHIHGLAPKRAGELLGISPQACCQYARRGMRKLRNHSAVQECLYGEYPLRAEGDDPLQLFEFPWEFYCENPIFPVSLYPFMAVAESSDCIAETDTGGRCHPNWNGLA